MTLPALLARGLKTLRLDLSAAIQQQLLAFLGLLDKWNHHYNLTAVRDPREMVPRHLLDSLSIVPFVKGPRVLDLGTGAGLPGVPLALALPQLQFTLLDGNAKKLAFVRQAVHELGLANVEVVQARAEQFRPPEKFDTLTARAVSALAELMPLVEPLRAPHGRVLAMKGVFPRAELEPLGAQYRIEVRALTVPGLTAQRHIVILESH